MALTTIAARNQRRRFIFIFDCGDRMRMMQGLENESENEAGRGLYRS